MSSEVFEGVPGVPDGYELLAIRRAKQGELRLVGVGRVCVWTSPGESDAIYPIIRKVETPKKYRPFNGGAEYMASPRRGVAVDWSLIEAHGFFAVVSANASFVWVAFGDRIEHFAWSEAFEKLVFRHADGSASPFGVEVTSE
jgi:hypothetical protein